MRNISTLLLIIFTGGCSITVPVGVISQRGNVLTGSATATISTGNYNVSNGTLSCSGSFDPGPGDVVPIRTMCNDGRSGSGQAIRDASKVAGRGTITLSDGETAEFIFGKPAEALRPK